MKFSHADYIYLNTTKHSYNIYTFGYDVKRNIKTTHTQYNENLWNNANDLVITGAATTGNT